MKHLLLSLTLVITVISVHAQQTIKGIVTDEHGETMVGVNVYEKGTNNGTVTDVDGSYSLKYKDEKAVFIFSFVGYVKQEITPSGQEEWNVTMKQGAEIDGVEIVGSRRPNRVSTETPVAIDIIEVSKVTNSYGQVDINQLLQYAAPSFNSNKQSGADGADHVDPATLRGLGPDQTLVLINGKRRHQSSNIILYGTRGRGNTGTDLNAIPAACIDRIEILRDGASAQYGSDAIAGVINIVLKSNVNELTANATAGFRQAHPPDVYDVVTDKKVDGETYQANANYGVKLGEDGYLNMTADYTQSNHTNRPTDSTKYAVYRKQFGDAAQQNFAAYANTSFKAGEKISLYGFGGYNYRFTDAYAFTRDPESERNVISIYPNGFDPRIQSVITDKSISLGAKANLRKWMLDANNTFGVNRFHFYVDGTLNASLEEKTPTKFDAGGFQLLQNTTTLNFSRLWEDILQGFNLAIGGEHRIENYEIFAGEEGSWQTYGPVIFSVDTTTDSTGAIVSVDTTFRPGGSQGFPGFRPANEVDESRTNIGGYVDAELDVTKWLLVSGAVRLEKYSDFGTTLNVGSPGTELEFAL